MTIKIKYVDIPSQFEPIKQEIIKKITEVCEGGQFILGPELQKLEKDFSTYCNAKYSIGVANGTDALFLSLLF